MGMIFVLYLALQSQHPPDVLVGNNTLSYSYVCPFRQETPPA